MKKLLFVFIYIFCYLSYVPIIGQQILNVYEKDEAEIKKLAEQTISGLATALNANKTDEIIILFLDKSTRIQQDYRHSTAVQDATDDSSIEDYIKDKNTVSNDIKYSFSPEKYYLRYDNSNTICMQVKFKSTLKGTYKDTQKRIIPESSMRLANIIVNRNTTGKWIGKINLIENYIEKNLFTNVVKIKKDAEKEVIIVTNDKKEVAKENKEEKNKKDIVTNDKKETAKENKPQPKKEVKEKEEIEKDSTATEITFVLADTTKNNWDNIIYKYLNLYGKTAESLLQHDVNSEKSAFWHTLIDVKDGIADSVANMEIAEQGKKQWKTYLADLQTFGYLASTLFQVIPFGSIDGLYRQIVEEYATKKYENYRKPNEDFFQNLEKYKAKKVQIQGNSYYTYTRKFWYAQAFCGQKNLTLGLFRKKPEQKWLIKEVDIIVRPIINTVGNPLKAREEVVYSVKLSNTHIVVDISIDEYIAICRQLQKPLPPFICE